MRNLRVRKIRTFDFGNPDGSMRDIVIRYELCGDILFYDPVFASATARLEGDGEFHLERTVKYKGNTENMNKSSNDLKVADRMAYDLLGESVRDRTGVGHIVIDESEYNEYSQNGKN
jgi:hypothetical protein